MKGFLFTADMHLRDTLPPCRTDNFLKTQWDKLTCITDFCRKNQLYWIDAGDVFHKAQPSIKFINEALSRMCRVTINGAIYGNHDLPSHNLNRANESAWDTLYHAGVIENILCNEPLSLLPGVHIYGASYGESIPTPEKSKHITNVLVMHDMVYKSKEDTIPNAPGTLARKILKNNPDYQLIVCGHNHQRFEVQHGNRALINVGSMTRQTADMAHHIPCALIWHPNTGEIEWLKLPAPQDVITREHLDKKEKREEEINAFVESLQNEIDISLSFEENVQQVLNKTQPDTPVIEKVREAME